MNKLIKIFAVALVVVMCCSALFACAPTDDNNKPEDPTKTRLASPMVVGNGQTVSWNAIENATGYDVYVDGTLADTVTTTYYVTTLGGEHEVYVIAKGNGTTTEDSVRSNKVKISGSVDVKTDSIFANMVLGDGSWDYSGDFDYALRFVTEHQSKDADLLKDFEDAFIEHLDNDGGFRGEYWGKTMRSAVLSYRYTLDEELYAIMENSTRRLLTAQEEDGRLATLDRSNEFRGWELWGRSYAVMGLLHFYSVCKDEALKTQIVESCKLQLDYVMERVGEGKIDILSTSPDWGGLPSSRILQAYLSVYCVTKEQKYLDYAEYLIGTGGSSMRSSAGRTILEDAELKTPFYMWGCRKIYEVTNFFDGILMYYMLTGNQRAKMLALNYYEVVKASEITETGGVATDVEEANNAVVEQANPSNLGRMQENCAVVVWLRYAYKIYRVFDILEAVDIFEKAYYSIVMATVDYDLHWGLPFFSYNPLATTAKTTTYSGGTHVHDRFFSCCVAMGHSALGLAPRLAVMTNAAGLSVNLYLPGTVTATTPQDKEVKLLVDSELPDNGNVSVRLSLAQKESFAIRFRIPDWSKTTTVKVNGVVIKNVNAGSYCTINRQWTSGDKVELSFDMSAYLIHGSADCSNSNAQYNVVVKRGPLVFARDRRIEGDEIFKPVTFAETNGKLQTELTEVNFRNQTGLKVKTTDGYITLVDYGSAGKTQSDESIMCLWIPTRDYWTVDLSQSVVVRACWDGGSPNIFIDNVLKTAQAYKDSQDKNVLANFAWKFVPVDGKEGWYRILDVKTGTYLTVNGNGYTINGAALIGGDDDAQLFRLKEVGLNRFKIEGKYGKLLTVHDVTLDTYMWEDHSHDMQYWYFESLA